MKITTMLAAVLFNITLADIFYAACPCATLAEKTAATNAYNSAAAAYAADPTPAKLKAQNDAAKNAQAVNSLPTC